MHPVGSHVMSQGVITCQTQIISNIFASNTENEILQNKKIKNFPINTEK